MARPFGRVLEGVTASDPTRAALIIDGTVTTYGELDGAVDRCRAGLRSAGVIPGQRIPLVDDTSVLSTAALIATTHVGAAAALMNPRLTSGELAVLMEAAETAPIGVAGPGSVGLLGGTGHTTVLGLEVLLGVAPGDRQDAPRPRAG